MSVLSCHLLPTDFPANKDNKFKRSYTHTFRIKCSSRWDLQATVMEGMHTAEPHPVPELWTIYNIGEVVGVGTSTERDTSVALQNIQLKKIRNSKYLWDAVCTWSSPEAGESSNDPPVENPLNRPVKYHLEWAQFTKKITRDVVDNRLIANSAGDLFDIERDDARPVLVAVKNEWPLTAIIAKSLLYKNAINNATFYGAPAGCAKMESIVSGTILNENDVDYYAVTYRIQFTTEDEGDWNLVLENKGTMAYDIPKGSEGAVKSRVKVLEGDLAGELKDFAYLAYDGTQLYDDEDPLPIPEDGEDPYRIYYPRDFSGLGIGTS